MDFEYWVIVKNDCSFGKGFYHSDWNGSDNWYRSINGATLFPTESEAILFCESMNVNKEYIKKVNIKVEA